MRDVSISCDEGTCIALIGANGAGKTTTLRAITGLVKPFSGEVRFQEERIEMLDPSEIVNRGISMVPEGRRVFPLMSVRDNLLMGAHSRRDTTTVRADLDRLS